ncbi:SEC-C metal-binding domain-containing protein [bacterium]|nr:SEC-C metal-binding domain-containing protein [bacterium]MDB4731699.1 SEC-C metal-binding domain-containing protein [bacterium]MDB4793034.1 SEC-C metal-binding domain-containing protein [bacterium]
MQTTLYNSASVSKNSPCLCGSGKKHKKCCLHRFKALTSTISARTPLSWLKQVVDGHDIGERFPKNNRPVHANSQYPKWSPLYTGKPNAQLLAYMNELFSCKREQRRLEMWLGHRWDTQTIHDHCNESRTLYFTGAGSPRQRYTLLMIDVDCKTMGSPAGARAYLEFLRDNYFPNLYIEVSTNGNGGHGFLLIDKEELGGEALNVIYLHQLQPWLDQLSKPFDVEFVELKGTLPNVEWNQHGEVEDYTCGQLAKVPRGLVSRFDELKQTCCIRATEFRKLPVIRPEHHPAVIAHVIQSSAGSISGKYITDEMLSGLEEEGCYHTMAKELFQQKGVDRLTTSDRNIVNVDDLAVMLMILGHCTRDLDENGGLPTARVEGMWNSLMEADDVSRPFNARRYHAMRDFLSDLGLLEWVDETYRVGYFKDGTWCKGVCMKWSLTEEFMQQIACLREASAVDLHNEREEGHPLLIQILNKIHLWVADLEFCDPDDEIRPLEIIQIDVSRYDPDKVTAMVGYFELQAA